jgi:hypothetical protein
MAESLEAMLEDTEIGGNPNANTEGFALKEVVAELDKALNQSSFFSKSNITNRNLRGILKANSFQEYIQFKYGFRIKVLDELIEGKLRNVLSIDGKGRKEIRDMIGQGTSKIEVKSGVDIGDRLFGGSGGMPR